MNFLDTDLKHLFGETLKCKENVDFRSLIAPSVNNEERTVIEISNWIRFARVYLSNSDTFVDALNELNKGLAHRSFLVDDCLSYADIAIWARLHCSDEWYAIHEAACKINQPDAKVEFVHLHRLYNHLTALPGLQEAAKSLALVRSAIGKTSTAAIHPKTVTVTKKVAATKGGQSAKDMKFEEGGKFDDLPGAKMGEVVVRFPPEASGFMHIGHAKAALLNQHYKQTFNGKLLLRFDDTNPTKEMTEYEEAIMSDLPRIGFVYDSLSYTSDHFAKILDFCTQLIKAGKAYADNTDSETMKNERDLRQDSRCRNNSVETNLAWWKEMQEGTPHGLKTCIRAKIDMKSDNGAMRDPAIYRCKLDPHIRTGKQYKVYPIYDFACPIVDSLEGVTHSLRTSEYNDRNEQFYWMCDALNIRKPMVIDYSRLNLQNTILSKRKLTWFVEQGLVTGWDDPRMPTVQGILRHGLTPEGLRQFILAQGSSRSVAVMEWDKIWAFNKKVIDPIAPRFTGLHMKATSKTIDAKTPHGLVAVHVNGQVTAATKQTPLHPKDASIGEKAIVLAPIVFIEQADAECFQEGENVTFINWGNLRVIKVHKTADGSVTRVDADLNLSDTDFKKTQKVTWLADALTCKNLPEKLIKLTPMVCINYGNIISKPVLAKEDDFKNFINKDSVVEECYLGDPQICDVKKGDIIQLQRKGFYICDEAYQAVNPATGMESPCVLIYIPDGASKARPTTGSKFKAGEAGDQPKTTSCKTAKSAASTSNLSPEEQAIKDAKERLKEEKKMARKQAKEKAKLGGAGGISMETPDVTEMTVSPVVNTAPPSSQPETVGNKPQKEKKKKTQQQPQKTKQQSTETEKPSVAADSGKKQTRLGLEAKKDEDTAEWYQQVITKAEMLEYYDVSGCYILRPWSFYIWTKIQEYFNKFVERLGVDQTYFPMFVSKAALEQEKKHIADFAPEVAWVTRSGDSEMAEPIAIRPTSETIMYPAFAKWIKSHRDLPLKINQWSNIVRWEFKHPTPFLRTREFLWQEGHTAFANKLEAEEEVINILNLYRDVYQELLAVPVVKGRKTEREKFPGGDYTTTTEVFISASGRSIQGATSHHLGQNFSRIFDVVFEDPETKQPKFVYQNSWGLTTRSIGVMIMVHADNQGLVLPPRVAKYQVVVVPCGITAKTTTEEREQLHIKAREITKTLTMEAGVRVFLDDRDHVSPGWKFNHWELKGVPIRVEIGFKDVAAKQVTAVVRFSGAKMALPEKDLAQRIPALLDEVHTSMLEKALQLQTGHIVAASNMNELGAALDKKCLAVVPFCEAPACEDCVRDESARNVTVVPGAPSMGAKSLCIPFEDQLPGMKTGAVTDGSHCLRYPLCKTPAKSYVLFGRSY